VPGAAPEPAAASVAGEPSLVVTIGVDGSEFVVAARFGPAEHFGPWTLPLAPDSGDLAGLLEAALRRSAGRAVAVEAGPDVPGAVVVALLDALRQGGVVDVSFVPAHAGAAHAE
jgi:hypothetical protein